MSKTFFEKFMSDNNSQKVYYEESLITDAAEMIYGLMQTKRMKNKDLAKKLGVSCSQITYWLDGTANMQLRTVASILFELGCKARLDAEPLIKTNSLLSYQATKDTGWRQTNTARRISAKSQKPNYKVA